MKALINWKSEVEYYERDNGSRFKVVGQCPPNCAYCCLNSHPLPGMDPPCPLLDGDKCSWQKNKPLFCLCFPITQEDIDKFCPKGAWRIVELDG